MIARHFPSEDYRKTLLWACYIILPFVILAASLAYAHAADAHGGAYCGTSTRYVTGSDGKFYKQVFRYHYANDDHHWTSRRFIWSGTGYVPVGDKHHHRTDCGHNH